MTRARAVSAPAVLGWGLAVALPLVFLGVFFAWPVAALVGRGFLADGGGVELTGLRDVLGSPRTWRLVGTTLAQAAAGSVASVLLGLPVAYLLYRTRFPGRGVLRGVVTVPFVLPTVVVGVAFTSLFRPGGMLGWAHLDETFAAVVVALVFFNVSVVVRTVAARGAFWIRAISPTMSPLPPTRRIRSSSSIPVRCEITI